MRMDKVKLYASIIDKGTIKKDFVTLEEIAPMLNSYFAD